MTTTPVVHETHAGTLKIGDLRLPCAVLSTGERVISSTGFNEAFGQGKKGLISDGGTGVPQLPRFLAAKALNPFIGADFAECHKPIVYQPKQGGRAGLGYSVDILTDAARVIIEAERAGVLRSTQQPLVDAALRLLLASSKVGWRALVDEACGYLPQVDAYRDLLHEELGKPPTKPQGSAKWRTTSAGARRPRGKGRLAAFLRDKEKRLILEALRENNGHNGRTATALGIARRALYDKMRDYGLEGEAIGLRTAAAIPGPRKAEIDVLDDGTVTLPRLPPVRARLSDGSRKGRPRRIAQEVQDAVYVACRKGEPPMAISERLKVSVATVYRYRREAWALN